MLISFAVLSVLEHLLFFFDVWLFLPDFSDFCCFCLTLCKASTPCTTLRLPPGNRSLSEVTGKQKRKRPEKLPAFDIMRWIKLDGNKIH
jgi:hypothetical protein